MYRLALMKKNVSGNEPQVNFFGVLTLFLTDFFLKSEIFFSSRVQFFSSSGKFVLTSPRCCENFYQSFSSESLPSQEPSIRPIPKKEIYCAWKSASSFVFNVFENLQARL